ncbi:NAD(P)-dependent oxidoreductase [Salibacterium halotolerans]|uniref:3-hydroxyisobutyrate dehydrogenase n=1 Tax=Salibacterium halotolerans TaxID=1884432 RepID=A0A1I5PC18_9BACI|nr:DUF1932 domain-containing protein [Salibacterium halotolerans]SFP31447.1 3-hydroxyisobutyrate dehydrogenase [Salibacterium halotolerans]
MRIGFIGFGEVSYELSKGFKEESVTEIYAYDPLYDREEVKEKAKELGVVLYPDPVQVAQQQPDVLITAVPAQHAWDAWEKVSLGPLHEDTIYVDVSTAGASVKNTVYEQLLNKNHYFVDVALMGPLPVFQHRVSVLASGSGVDAFMERMRPFHMNIEKVSDRTGDATNIKFIRSIYTKGLSMLFQEVLQLSYKLELSDMIIESISQTMDEKPFKEIMNRLVTGSAIHSERREAEMSNVVSFMEANDERPIMAEAIKERLADLTSKGLRETFHNETPESWRTVMEEINKKGGVIHDETRQ